jgi:hypothetical protein
VEKLTEAYEAATEKAIQVQPGLDPHRVLSSWDFDGENLGISGAYAKKINSKAFEAGEEAFFQTLS